MQNLLEETSAAPPLQRQRRLIERILARPELHARLVNSLARLEYVGVRKMLKARRAERLDLEGLQHLLEEAGHALRLKKAALRVAESCTAAGAPVSVETFAPEHTLAGEEGERYFQGVDHAAEESLQDLPEAERGEPNYLLTSAAIELRAEAFYPLYEECLRAAGAPFSVAPISKDEHRHLAEMEGRLTAALPGWKARLRSVLARERDLFGEWLGVLEALCKPDSGTVAAAGSALPADAAARG